MPSPGAFLQVFFLSLPLLFPLSSNSLLAPVASLRESSTLVAPVSLQLSQLLVHLSETIIEVKPLHPSAIAH